MADDAPVAIAGYRDFVPIGRGLTSIVYSAHEERVGRSVAVKVLTVDDLRDPARRRFERERDTMARLGTHPFIVQILDFGATEAGQPFIAMDLHKESVADRVAERGSFELDLALEIAQRVATAVQRAHDLGVLHRDIKPQNILLSGDDPALTDFGIARASTGLEWTQSLAELTPLHAAPELFTNAAPTTAADVYALSSTLFTMLAGQEPFPSPPDEVITAYGARVATAPIPRVPRTDVPPEVHDVLTRALAKRPEDRPPSAAALADELRRILVHRHGAAADDRLAPIALPTAERSTPPDRDDPAPPIDSVRKTPTVVRPGAAPPAETPSGPPRDEPAPHRAHRRLAIVAAGVLSVLLGVVVAVALLAGGDGEHPPPVTVPASVPHTRTDPALAPTDLVARDSGSLVELTWTDNTGGDGRYVVVTQGVDRERRIDSVDELGATSYTVSGVEPDVPYCFRVIAIVRGEDGQQVDAFADTEVRGCTVRLEP